MLDAKENLEDYSSCDITATTSVDKNHDTFDESAILGENLFLLKVLFGNFLPIYLQGIYLINMHFKVEIDQNTPMSYKPSNKTGQRNFVSIKALHTV